MKIDLSTIALIVALVVPGLFFEKGRRTVVPKTFESSGSTTELGELVWQSLAVHLIWIALGAFLTVAVGVGRGSVSSAFRTIDRCSYSSWAASHPSEALLCVAAYGCLAIFSAYPLGLLGGILSLNRPVFHWFETKAWFSTALRSVGVYAILGEEPLSFQLFTGQEMARGQQLLFFLEMKLRDDKGYITGALAQYSIVRDEESHRLVVLQEPYFKAAEEDDYIRMTGERVVVDLSDALFLQVSYEPRIKAVAEVTRDRDKNPSIEEG